jgi:ubiquinone/menaquinone biosynthesis C-methylase UbiE
MKRVVIPELLDTDAGTAEEVQATLADLRFFNRWFGGIATSIRLLQRVAQETGSSKLSILDVAAASGDVAQAARAQLERIGIELEITLLDRSRAHLNNGARAVVGDALRLPFRDGSFDVVGCGLFAHHLEPEEVVQFVNEALRVCRSAAIINDLVRHPLHLTLVYAGLPIYRGRMTRNDAPASVRRAYTPEEMINMLRNTRASRVEISRHYLFRMGVIAWK